MGGARGEGNVTPSAEFNIYADPHAAKVVFEAGVPLVMHGLDVTHQALVTAPRLAAIRALGTPVSAAVAGLLAFYNRYDQTRRGPPRRPLPTPAPSRTSCAPRCSRAATATSRSRPPASTRSAAPWSTGPAAPARKPNAKVITEVDADAFFALVTERLARLPLTRG